MISDATTYTTTATPDTNTTITTTTTYDDDRTTTMGAVAVAGRVAAVEEAAFSMHVTEETEGMDAERSEASSGRRTDTGPLMDNCFGPISSTQRVIDLTRY